MATRAREREEVVTGEIEAAGGRIIDRYKDGATHNVVVYTLNGHEADFHYASTAGTYGCRMLNMRARLRRELAEVKARPPAVTRVVQTEPSKRDWLAPVVRATPPKPKVDRKEMVKSYLTMGSLQEFMDRYELDRVRAENLILSSRGQSAEKLRREINLEKAAAAKRAREGISLAAERIEIPATIEVIGPASQPEHHDKRTYATGVVKRKRDRKIQIYCQYGVAPEEAAEIFNLSLQQIRRIIRTGKQGERTDAIG